MNKKKTTEILTITQENLDYLYRFAFFRIGDRQEAEDVVQTAVLRVLEKGLGNVQRNNIRMYLFKAVYNLCTDYDRHKDVNTSLDNVPKDLVDDDENEHLMYREYDRTMSLLADLPEREAEVIRAKAIDEFHFVEIAQILNTPVTTVQSRYKSGMNRLKSKINHHND